MAEGSHGHSPEHGHGHGKKEAPKKEAPKKDPFRNITPEEKAAVIEAANRNSQEPLTEREVKELGPRKSIGAPHTNQEKKEEIIPPLPPFGGREPEKGNNGRYNPLNPPNLGIKPEVEISDVQRARAQEREKLRRDNRFRAEKGLEPIRVVVPSKQDEEPDDTVRGIYGMTQRERLAWGNRFLSIEADSDPEGNRISIEAQQAVVAPTEKKGFGKFIDRFLKGKAKEEFVPPETGINVTNTAAAREADARFIRNQADTYHLRYQESEVSRDYLDKRGQEPGAQQLLDREEFSNKEFENLKNIPRDNAVRIAVAKQLGIDSWKTWQEVVEKLKTSDPSILDYVRNLPADENGDNARAAIMKDLGVLNQADLEEKLMLLQLFNETGSKKILSTEERIALQEKLKFENFGVVEYLRTLREDDPIRLKVLESYEVDDIDKLPEKLQPENIGLLKYIQELEKDDPITLQFYQEYGVDNFDDLRQKLEPENPKVLSYLQNLDEDNPLRKKFLEVNDAKDLDGLKAKIAVENQLLEEYIYKLSEENPVWKQFTLGYGTDSVNEVIGMLKKENMGLINCLRRLPADNPIRIGLLKGYGANNLDELADKLKDKSPKLLTYLRDLPSEDPKLAKARGVMSAGEWGELQTARQNRINNRTPDEVINPGEWGNPAAEKPSGYTKEQVDRLDELRKSSKTTKLDWDEFVMPIQGKIEESVKSGDPANLSQSERQVLSIFLAAARRKLLDDQGFRDFIKKRRILMSIRGDANGKVKDESGNLVDVIETPPEYEEKFKIYNELNDLIPVLKHPIPESTLLMHDVELGNIPRPQTWFLKNREKEATTPLSNPSPNSENSLIVNNSLVILEKAINDAYDAFPDFR